MWRPLVLLMVLPDHPSPFGRTALPVVAVLCLGYVLSQFYRSSVGVIGPALTADMGLSAEAVGALGGMFFLVFGLAQIPIGVALDRFGPRAVNATLLLVAAAGALMFAAAGTGTGLTIARGVIGLGCASAFMGSLVVFSRWFAPERFPGMASVVLAVGGLGGLVATTPLALAADLLGWRGAFVLMAAATVAVAALVYWLVRDAPPGASFHVGERETLGDAVRGLAEVLGNRQLYLLLPLNAVAYASVITVLGLWGVPYLHDVQGMTVVEAAEVMMAMAVTLMLGALAFGWLSPHLGGTKKCAVVGALGVAVSYVTLALLPPSGAGVLYTLFAFAGFTGAYSVMLVTHVRALFPRRLVGRGLTTANLFNFGGAGVMQGLSGLIVGAFSGQGARHSAAAGYSALFWSLAAVIVLATVIYLVSRDPATATAH